MSKLASISFAQLNKTVLVEVLFEQVTKNNLSVHWACQKLRWTPLPYFKTRELARELIIVSKIPKKALWYAFKDGVLYKRSYLELWLKCITPKERDQIIREIYEVLCRAHVVPRILAKKDLFLRYFWPTMQGDCRVLIQSCSSLCNRVPSTDQPDSRDLFAWLFEQRGTDIIDPFPWAIGWYPFLVVAMDYFTK